MPKDKVVRKAAEILDKSKVWIIYLAVPLILVVYYFKLYGVLKDVLVAYITAWLLLFLIILFDIDKQVKEKPEKRIILKDGWDVIPRLKELLEAGKNRPQNVKIFALTLDTAWPQIKSVLTGADYKNIDIKLLQVDPSLDGLESIHSGWTNEVEYTRKDIENFTNFYKDDLNSRGISIQVKQYKYGPCIHGYLVNDKYLFFSLCKWDSKHGGLTGHPCMYEHFDRIEDERQRPYFELFNNWFDRFFKDKA